MDDGCWSISKSKKNNDNDLHLSPCASTMATRSQHVLPSRLSLLAGSSPSVGAPSCDPSMFTLNRNAIPCPATRPFPHCWSSRFLSPHAFPILPAHWPLPVLPVLLSSSRVPCLPPFSACSASLPTHPSSPCHFASSPSCSLSSSLFRTGNANYRLATPSLPVLLGNFAFWARNLASFLSISPVFSRTHLEPVCWYLSNLTQH